LRTRSYIETLSLSYKILQHTPINNEVTTGIEEYEEAVKGRDLGEYSASAYIIAYRGIKCLGVLKICKSLKVFDCWL